MESADGQYNIAKAPLYFVRSGGVYINNGALVEMGQNAFGWSSHKETSVEQYVYVLHFNPTDLTSAYGVEEHYYAFPLRCLARQ